MGTLQDQVLLPRQRKQTHAGSPEEAPGDQGSTLLGAPGWPAWSKAHLGAQLEDKTIVWGSCEMT